MRVLLIAAALTAAADAGHNHNQHHHHQRHFDEEDMNDVGQEAVLHKRHRHHSHHKHQAEIDAAQPVPTTAESTLSRATIKTAMNALITEETKKVMAYIDRRAVDLGQQQAVLKSKANAKLATQRAYRATLRITGEKATSYCKSLSKLGHMPALCEQEAKVLLKTLTREALTRWEGNAVDAATPKASTDAANAAKLATKTATATDIKVAANRIAKRVFQLEFPKAENEWNAIYDKEEETLKAKKVEFFKKFTAATIEKARASVRTALWDAPIKSADARMTAAAKTQAEATSARVAAETLAPKFVQAARAALPLAVRTAHHKAMDGWVPGWKPEGATVDGFTADLIA